MIRLRSFLPFVLALVPLAVGCKKDDPAKATPETSFSAPAISSAKVKLPMRGPMAPMPKIEPLAMKEYRLDVCWFGTLTLRQARDAYLASLGKDEPSEKKIPSFGAPVAPTLAAAPKSPTIPMPSALAAGPAPSAVAGPASSLSARRIDLGLRAPHERNARACTVAAGLKDPAMGDVDAAIVAFAPFALELSRRIAETSVYYQREEFKKDKFEKGKDLHKKLIADFAKLDELSDKLGVALAAYRKEHPVDLSKLDEGEKLTAVAYDKGRELVVSLLPKKIDVAAYKANVAALEKEIEALKAFGTGHASDAWASVTVPSFEALLKAAKTAEGKISDKGIESEAFLSVINTFSALVESKNRALSRMLIAKGQVLEPRGGAKPNLPLRPVSPHPNVGQEPAKEPGTEAPADPH